MSIVENTKNRLFFLVDCFCQVLLLVFEHAQGAESRMCGFDADSL